MRLAKIATLQKSILTHSRFNLSNYSIPQNQINKKPTRNDSRSVCWFLVVDSKPKISEL